MSGATSSTGEVPPAAKRARTGEATRQAPCRSADSIGCLEAPSAECGEAEDASSTSGDAQRLINIHVSGIAGPICTLQGARHWTIQQVQEAICQASGAPITRQSLLMGTKKLLPQVRIEHLLLDPTATSLQLTMVKSQAPQGFVSFVECYNGLEQLEPGHLRKTGGVAWSWNATAVSKEGFLVGQGHGLRFRPAERTKDFILGLGSVRPPRATYLRHRDIDFAFWCCFGGVLDVAEKGVKKFRSHREYSAASVMELRVTDKVEYFLDGQLEYTSELEKQETLWAMASFFDIGAEVFEIRWL